jgi:hypothetical protein
MVFNNILKKKERERLEALFSLKNCIIYSESFSKTVSYRISVNFHLRKNRIFYATTISFYA